MTRQTYTEPERGDVYIMCMCFGARLSLSLSLSLSSSCKQYMYDVLVWHRGHKKGVFALAYHEDFHCLVSAGSRQSPSG